MSETSDTSIEIMGKIYQIKCPTKEIDSLTRSAEYLEEKMRKMRESGVTGPDRLAVITALNVVHQLLTLEQQKNNHFNALSQKLSALQNKVEDALAQKVQWELSTEE